MALEKKKTFSKKIWPILRGIFFQVFLLKIRQSKNEINNKKELSEPFPLISMLDTSFKGFGQVQTYVTTLIWGESGGNCVVSRDVAPDCRRLLVTSIFNTIKDLVTSSFKVQLRNWNLQFKLK